MVQQGASPGCWGPSKFKFNESARWLLAQCDCHPKRQSGTSDDGALDRTAVTPDLGTSLLRGPGFFVASPAALLGEEMSPRPPRTQVDHEVMPMITKTSSIDR